MDIKFSLIKNETNTVLSMLVISSVATTLFLKSGFISAEDAIVFSYLTCWFLLLRP